MLEVVGLLLGFELVSEDKSSGRTKVVIILMELCREEGLL